jgi:hypothetical protein
MWTYNTPYGHDLNKLEFCTISESFVNLNVSGTVVLEKILKGWVQQASISSLHVSPLAKIEVLTSSNVLVILIGLIPPVYRNDICFKIFTCVL